MPYLDCDGWLHTGLSYSGWLKSIIFQSLFSSTIPDLLGIVTRFSLSSRRGLICQFPEELFVVFDRIPRALLLSSLSSFLGDGSEIVLSVLSSFLNAPRIAVVLTTTQV